MDVISMAGASLPRMNVCAVLLITFNLFVMMMDKSAAQIVATSLAKLQAYSSCLTVGDESFMFFLFDVSLVFNDAKTFCASLVNLDDETLNTGLTNPSFFLARVSSLEEMTQVLVILNTQVPRVADRNNFWIGLKDDTNNGGTIPINRFLSWADGTTKGLNQSFIGVNRGFFPWDLAQPNDANDNQNCVRWNAATNLLDDQICSQNNAILCRVDCDPDAFQPTISPTQSPTVLTNAPTSSPTSAAQLIDDNQIATIAGISVLSVVGLFLILGAIYGMRSIYKEKQVLNYAMSGSPKQSSFKDFQIEDLSSSNEVDEYESTTSPKLNEYTSSPKLNEYTASPKPPKVSSF